MTCSIWVQKGQSGSYAVSLPQQGTAMCLGNAKISNIGTRLQGQTLLFLSVPVHMEELLLKCVFTQNITRIVKARAWAPVDQKAKFILPP